MPKTELYQGNFCVCSCTLAVIRGQNVACVDRITIKVQNAKNILLEVLLILGVFFDFFDLITTFLAHFGNFGVWAGNVPKLQKNVVFPRMRREIEGLFDFLASEPCPM